ncbi:hypothetical protein JK232_05430 [Nissabacter archeti]|uniref:6-bladed beta-propeller n=1 Tax=Nissabacter archeti TaxID=1917880 RepID=A0ABS5JEF6_9GAMM|nr:hypothetical protein [Nissabacter archeti]MBS0968332.1 hypothetical protein [Nissabacter archeti]
MRCKIAIILLPLIFYGLSHGNKNSLLYNNELGNLCWPTQASYENGKKIISDYKNKRIIFENEAGRLNLLSLSLHGSHSIRYVEGIGYLIDDTEGHRLIKLDNLENPNPVYLDKINNYPLTRPHDILDGKDGYAYVIDENRLFRISDFSGKGEAFKIDKSHFGYVRSLSLIDGKINIISASMGMVIRIDDFKNGKFTTFKTKSHKQDDNAGAYERTGPILNSVIKLGSYYYGSNYFTKSYAGNSDPNPYRLIRWKTWNDFKEGDFEDLSHLLELNQVPYFLSTHQGKLLITSFNHEKRCEGDKVFSFQP